MSPFNDINPTVLDYNAATTPVIPHEEVISFKHKFDCRKDPREPIKGKVSQAEYESSLVIIIISFSLAPWVLCVRFLKANRKMKS
jgi:hypothetical protein